MTLEEQRLMEDCKRMYAKLQDTIKELTAKRTELIKMNQELQEILEEEKKEAAMAEAQEVHKANQKQIKLVSPKKR